MRRTICLVVCVLAVTTVGAITSTAETSTGYAEIPETARITNIDSFLKQCPPQDELEILERDFPVLYEPEHGGPFVPYSCSGTISSRTVLSDALGVYQALRVIRHMKLSEPLPWTDLHPYEWLKSKIGAIIISSTTAYDYCCTTVDVPGKPDGTLAITIRKASDSLLERRTSWINRQSGVGLDGLVLLIFHEARHVDVPHTWGSGDATLTEMGAWGVQYTIAKWIGDGRIRIGTSVSSYYQDAAGWAAETALGRISDPDN